MTEAPDPLSDEELAQIDREYRPFPRFRDWSRDFPRRALWDKRREEFQQLSENVTAEQLDAAIRVAVRAAAFDTGAIEGLYATSRGLTMTVAKQAIAWEQELARHSDDAFAYFNAQLSAYELLLDVATQRLPVTEAWIRRLHEELTAPQESYTVHTPIGIQQHPLPQGQYKEHPNHVRLPDGSLHAYAPVDKTRDEMGRLVRELSGKAFAAAHPVIQAAYSHYAFVAIHPFADGNGRVARGLASVYLYRAASIPLLVFADQRDGYFNALAKADDGERGPFNALVGAAAIAAVELVADTLRATDAPSAEDALEALREIVTAQGGLSHAQIDELGVNLTNAFGEVLVEEIRRVELPIGVSVDASIQTNRNAAPPEGYRTLVQNPYLNCRLILASAGPAAAHREVYVRVVVSKDLDEDSDLFLLAPEGGGPSATFSLSDVHPRVTSVAEERMRILAGRLLGLELTALADVASTALRDSGYLG